MVFLAVRVGFPGVFFPEKRLDLKSLKRQTKAEELGPWCPSVLRLGADPLFNIFLNHILI
jgi:hypothetical protein